MHSNAQKVILIAPLDWGLGHTTRCIPLIRRILQQQHVPLFAGNKVQRQFINDAFPAIETIHLEGYNIRYSRSKFLFAPRLFSQVPRILKTIRKEQEWLQQLTKSRQIDGIISDNRYGLYHPTIPNVILTHQLRIQTGLGATANDLLQHAHYKFLKRFNSCWVVDIAEWPGLSGELSHPKRIPLNARYIGLLSQLDELCQSEKPGDYILILLSGPEPQRSILQEITWRQAVTAERPVVFVAGSNNAKRPDNVPAHIQYHPQMGSRELGPFMRDAAFVICRSGYSTLMDLIALQKAAVLIPTPGQTEQEYLGQYLQDHGIFMNRNQNEFQLDDVIRSMKGSPLSQNMTSEIFHMYIFVLEEFLKSL